MADLTAGSRSPSAPCRLFVYLARSAPVAIVLRRGPAAWARLSLWRTDTDTFEHGQWMRARVYERRSDVSADGSLFVAFVRRSAGRPTQGTADTWVAVSRPPYFTALAVWFIGGTYHTGGFFPDRSSVWTGFQSTPPDVGSVPAWLAVTPPRSIPYVDGTPNWPERTVFFNRLLRDGWKRTADDPHGTVWAREHPTLPLTLSMSDRFESFNRYGGPYVTEYALLDRRGGETRLGRATWADWDQRGRLLLARNGQLIEWTPDSGEQVVEDFNGHRPDPAAAPAWVETWPPAPTS